MTPEPPRLSRRQLLASGGLFALGAVAGIAGDLAVRRVAAPGAPASAPPLSGTAEASPLIDGPSPTPAPTPTQMGAWRTFRTRPELVAPLVELSVVRGIPAPGLIFLTAANGAGGGGLTIVDSAGELVWAMARPSAAVTDLRVATFRGAPVLTWWEGDNNAGIGTGEHVVMDASYREVTRVRAGAGRKADLHEFRLTNHGTALFFADASVALPAGATAAQGSPVGAPSGPVASPARPAPPLMDCCVQEVDLATGDLVFEWHSSEHVGIDESLIDAPTGNGVWDYFHGNSIEEDADGTLLVSARNTSAVYKVDRATGRIVWRLGGRKSDFRLGPGASFALQHDVRRQADGTITVFDDGQGPGASRGIVLRVDERAMTATLERAYPQPNRLFSTSQGNVQILPNGHVFIGWGSTPRFSEFAPDGTLLLDAGFTASQSSRDGRFAWTGRPATPPDVAVDRNGEGLVVYASWNGATEVATWQVLAGSTVTALRQVGATPRTGFETMISVGAVQSADRYVVVAARDAVGRLLGSSAPAAVPA